ncbi:DNA repair protein RecO [Flavobacteriaceae bacterium F89]|uniref:DNA repair protein RecO n=1 Tax=Cerina litoralis TaxID=2874477 RepID=A0AAE3ETC9_9FLAO|nr:DNA repair protein RecO [Cerina litoralis]MCG2460120.1 DNA repair protein RecO [Cerina litoralis]
MQVTTKAIVFSSLKYGDTSLIVKAFTESDGLKSYLLKGIMASKRGKLRVAHFQPLSQLEIVAVHRNKGTLESIREAKTYYPYSSLYTDIAKNAMTQFLAEMLHNSIHEEERNQDLYHFLETTLQWLDAHDNIANFHLFFLLSLTRYLGFYPDTTHLNHPHFDLLEGEFVQAPSLNPMMPAEVLDHFKRLCNNDFGNIGQVEIKKSDRRLLLERMVLYFELHLQGFRKPKSLAVLHEVFG